MAQTIVYAIPDLFFGVRVADVARALGYTPLEASLTQLPDALHDDVALIVVDINQHGDWEAIIRSLKATPATATIPILAFGAHVDVGSSRTAVAAGCDRLVTRGKLMAELPKLLQANARPSS